MRALILSSLLLAAAPPVFAQQPVQRAPFVPLFQPTVPQANPTRMTPSMTNVPSTTVMTPQRYYPGAYGFPGTVYYNNTGASNPFGVATGGFTGVAPTGQFYAVMGGPAPSNPFINNPSPFGQTWPNTTGGINSFGQQSYPFNYSGYGPQYPMVVNPPTVVGQSNGLFGVQQPQIVPGLPAAPGLPLAPPPVVAPVVPQPNAENNFGIQVVPGINGPAPK